MIPEAPQQTGGHAGASSSRSLRKRLLFWAVLLSIPGLGAFGLWEAWRIRRVWMLDGVKLNRAAWEASFTERGLKVPEGGPREGYWGRRMPRMVHDKYVGWHEGEVHRPGFVEVDETGMQVYALGKPRAQVMIVGASVAWGAYASTEDETYYAHAARQLKDAGWPLRLSVMATGRWTSDNEVKAFRRYSSAANPDVVVFLDGLNDLGHDTGLPGEARAGNYLEHIRAAHELARSKGVGFVVVLQPTLAIKKHKTLLERRILALTQMTTLVPTAYASIREGLREITTGADSRFVDCSDALGGETKTTFSDIWHFGDPGHRLLGHCLAEGLLPALVAHETARRASPDATPAG